MLFSLKPGLQTQLGITGTCLAAFFLFGYDQGVFGGLVTNEDFLETFGNPDPALLGLIVSIYNIGCIIGCILTFAAGPRFGRRPTIWVAMGVLSIGAIIQVSAFSVPQMMIGRVITGIGVGIDTSTVPTYQAELCKASHRGRLVTTEVLFTAVGVSFAYFFSFGLSYVGGVLAWRLPIALQIILALPVAVVLFALPETPRWLMQKGRAEEATRVMTQVFNLPESDPYIHEEKAKISQIINLEQESNFRWTHLLRKDVLQTRWRIFLGCLSQAMNQWSGINVVVFYASVVLEENVGLSRQTALVVGGCLNLAFAFGSLVPALGADKLGRKKPMMIGSFCMAVSMMLVAIMLSFKGTDKETIFASVSIAFFITFMMSFGASLNAIPWCYSAEIVPLRTRAQGAATAVLTNWIFVFVIVMITPTIVTQLQWKAYLIFMSTNFVFVPTIYFLFPETANKSLEEIDLIFIKDDAVRRSSLTMQTEEFQQAFPDVAKDIEVKHLEKS